MSIVDLDRIRKGRALLEGLQARYATVTPPRGRPEAFGWVAVEHDEDGRPCRWFQARYEASIGFVAGAPEFVYVDYRQCCVAYLCTIEELVAGIETGLMPASAGELGTGCCRRE